jgi:hypothetical protein
MQKIILLLLCSAFFIACNNNSKNSPGVKAADSASKGYTWTADDEQEFLAGCVDNAKAGIGDTAAYALCKCVLGEVKKSFPKLDSSAMNVLMDSTQAAAFAAKCK